MIFLREVNFYYLYEINPNKSTKEILYVQYILLKKYIIKYKVDVCLFVSQYEDYKNLCYALIGSYLLIQFLHIIQ